MNNRLKIALPKGSLQEPTLDLMKRAGFNVYMTSRGYRPSSNDDELDIFVIRAQEIGRYIDQGFVDCGITGYDWGVCEYGTDLTDLATLSFSKVTARPTKWVLCVPEDSPIQTVKDLEGKTIATEGIGMTKAYLAKHGVNANVEFSWGATEVKVPELVDAIVDITETGNSIRANKLRIVDTLLESYPHFYANKEAVADSWKREKMDRITMLLKGALEARDQVGLKMNVHADSLDAVASKLDSLRKPTVNRLSEDQWYAIEVIIHEAKVRELIPVLKELGAEGIIEYPLNKIVY